jgi:hypothetical protein
MDKTEAVMTERYTDFSGSKLPGKDALFLFYSCTFMQNHVQNLRKRLEPQ